MTPVDQPVWVTLDYAIALVRVWRGCGYREAVNALRRALHAGNVVMDAVMPDGSRRPVTPLELHDLGFSWSSNRMWTGQTGPHFYSKDNESGLDIHLGLTKPALKRPVIERASLERVFKQPAPPPSETEAPAVAGADSAALSRDEAPDEGAATKSGAQAPTTLKTPKYGDVVAVYREIKDSKMASNREEADELAPELLAAKGFTGEFPSGWRKEARGAIGNIGRKGQGRPKTGEKKPEKPEKPEKRNRRTPI
jgi:hypothetical protein